ncbi:MAG: DNA mismatch repair protein MutS [Halodesulfurarchaeum sp.]
MSAAGIVGEYQALRQEAEADLLAMQMGDFFEFFGEDARTVHEELDLKISERSSGGETYDMAGVPVDDLEPYLTALVERGYRVAVAEQIEVEGGHERELSRVVTPATLLEPTETGARYLATVVREGSAIGLAFLDLTSGRFQVTSIDDEDAIQRAVAELSRFEPAELLPGPDVRDSDLESRLRAALETTITRHDREAFAAGRGRQVLDAQFGSGAAASVGIEDEPAAVRAAGAAIAYVEETGVGALPSITRLREYRTDDHVALDGTTRRNLEVTEPMAEGGTALLETVDHTVTAAGGRLLAERLVRPTRDIATLERRHDAVGAIVGESLARERLRDIMADAYDLSRLVARAASGRLEAPGLARVRETVALLEPLAEVVDESPTLASSPIAERIEATTADTLETLETELGAALVDEPEQSEVGVIDPEYDEDLAEIVADLEAARDWIDGLAQREQDRLNLPRLSVGRNKTDGYYIEVPKADSEAIPAEYEGIKTLKNAERYVHPSLEEREREIRQLEERRAEREQAIVAALRDRVVDTADALQTLGTTIATIDVHAALATHAVRNDWTRPRMTEEDRLVIDQGRHPVVEQTVEFVPNDLHLDRERRFLVVTGPNMSGKSTYMRQAALIVLLAQAGSFVPASEAVVGTVDGIYTRVGALDELAGGRSTFMVEMQELSNILHSATDDSLVVLDEVGRGTATYDGISIAWAATEYLSGARSTAPTPKVLFATHYHELTQLADEVPGVANVHVAADERDGEVTFLHTVREGPANRSYGVHVADLAGVPEPVVDRAEDILTRLRKEEAIEVTSGAAGEGSRQMVFDLDAGTLRPADEDPDPVVQDEADEIAAREPAAEAVLEAIQELDVTETPPVDLMAKVQEWQATLEDQ